MLDDLGKPAGDQPDAEPETLQGAQQGPGAGGERDLLPHGVEDRRREAGQGRHPLVQALGEVDLTAHGPLGHLGDERLAPGMPSEQFDDLILDEGGVDIENDEPATAAGEPGRGDGDVDPLFAGDPGQFAAEHGEVGPGDVELHGGHREAGQPPDAVDVGAVGGQACRDRGHVGRREGGGQEHDRRPTGPPPPVVAVSGAHGHRHPQVMGDLVDGPTQFLLVLVRAEQHRQGQQTPDDDLFDVEDGGPDPADPLEEGAGDSGAVVTGQRDKEGPMVHDIRG